MDSKKKLQNKKILITCGPTWVPIDDVRIISNKSTGELGQKLAQDFAGQGARVTLLEGPGLAPMKSKPIKIIKFSYFTELSAAIQRELRKNYDVVVHAAAVSDYKLAKPFKAKLSSRLKRVHLTLVPTEKIINKIKRLSPKTFLIGFKLESSLTEKTARRKARDLVQSADCDLVVANSVNGQKYNGYIIDRSGEILAKVHSRANLSKILIRILKDRL